MAVEIPFRRDFAFEYGRLEEVAPGIRRIVARNPGPFTFRGTGTYVIGEGQVAVIDPGPDLPEHIEALLMDLAGEEVTHILVTHTHRDHSPAAAAVKEATGAPTYGFGPHAGGRRGEAAVGEGGDWDFVPDIVVKDGDEIASAPRWRSQAVHAPGHTSNHLCFALPDQGILFSGDHVMGWSTSVIAPPDGDAWQLIWPRSTSCCSATTQSVGRRCGAGDRPTEDHVRAFIAHRREREAGIVACLEAGVERVDAMVERLYVGLDPNLRRAAGRSVLAHLVDLIGREVVKSEGNATVDATYRLVRR